MPHPIMFRDGDPGLHELRTIALGFPEAFEKVSHGRPVFCAPKMFAIYGGSTKQTGDMITVPHCLLFKVDEAERAALEEDPRIFYPAYMGPYGWLGLDFTLAEPDWAEITELVDASYRLIASAKLIDRLDQA
jgi:predicted DNA-binding protein (MmcQ/YjbR family)